MDKALEIEKKKTSRKPEEPSLGEMVDPDWEREPKGEIQEEPKQIEISDVCQLADKTNEQREEPPEPVKKPEPEPEMGFFQFSQLYSSQSSFTPSSAQTPRSSSNTATRQTRSGVIVPFKC